jgi:hypothetical protein
LSLQIIAQQTTTSTWFGRIEAFWKSGDSPSGQLFISVIYLEAANLDFQLLT